MVGWYKDIDATTSGISLIAIRTAYCDTLGYYGETGFDEDYAYKYDNIKVSWKAPKASNFVECYRNDFAKSMRRTIDGSETLSHEYEMVENTETMTFNYPAQMVRAVGDYSQTGKPYLTAKFGTANTVQEVGVDGWRSAGNSGYVGALAITTDKGNRVGLMTKNSMVVQTMCPDITSGKVKFEYDFRMPRGWNGGSVYSVLSLLNNKAYDEEYNFMNKYSLLRVGPCSPSKGLVDGRPTQRYSIITSHKTGLWGSVNADWESKFKGLNWYRIQIFIDLDTGKYKLYVYDLGTSSPAKPENFDSSDTSKAIVSSNELDLYTSNTPGNPQEDPQAKYGRAIGMYGFTNWNFADDYGDGNPASDYAFFFDNIRCWKGDGANWTQVFQNDFTSSKRMNFTRRSLRLNPSGYPDCQEHGEDMWSSMPTYNAAVYAAGESNVALDAGQNIYSLVQPLSRTIRSGKLSAQYDVRIPNVWTSGMDYFWFQLGGGGLASASTWTDPKYRYQSTRTIRTGIQMGKNGSVGLEDDNTGINNRTAIVVHNGNTTGGGSNQAKHMESSVDHYRIGHWIRMKIDADMDTKTWSFTAYDLGKAHPTLATPDGSAISGASWSGLGFGFNEPITHIHLLGGTNPSYAPWRDDQPGALLVDNIRICHDKNGMVINLK